MHRLRTIVCLALAAALAAGATASARAASDQSFDFKLDPIHAQADTTMADFTGKPLVVVVWSPDCPHCRLEMPYVASLFRKLDPKTVQLLACSMGDREQTADYLSQMKIDFQVLYKAHVGDYISGGFTKDGWPNTFVFDKNGSYIGSSDATGQKYVDAVLKLVALAAPDGPVVQQVDGPPAVAPVTAPAAGASAPTAPATPAATPQTTPPAAPVADTTTPPAPASTPAPAASASPAAGSPTGPAAPAASPNPMPATPAVTPTPTPPATAAPTAPSTADPAPLIRPADPTPLHMKPAHGPAGPPAPRHVTLARRAVRAGIRRVLRVPSSSSSKPATASAAPAKPEVVPDRAGLSRTGTRTSGLQP